MYEIGRGPGGRASTRRTRSIEDLRIDHGAPFCEVLSKEGKELVDELGLKAFGGRHGILDPRTGVFTNDGDDEDEEGQGVRYVTGNDGDMSGIASSLLSSASLPIATRYSSMVRSLSHAADSRWRLHDKAGTFLGSADYLVVAGSGVAHPSEGIHPSSPPPPPWTCPIPSWTRPWLP